MRHALGVLGVLAATVLLVVSAAMNWRFGYELGITDFDKHLYATASAAADCLKALVPFLFFAAIRNRMWAQALASCVVWAVVTIYSFASAFGHAALNRGDTSGKRATQVQSYKDLRADLKRAKTQLGWVPAHRPADTVKSDMNGLQLQRRWRRTNGCTNVTARASRRFCDKHAKLSAELASARKAEVLETKISKLNEKLANRTGVTHSAADPQAAVLAKLIGIFMPGVKVEDVQTALAICIALLLEVGSGLGMYIAFAQWRLNDDRRTRSAAETVKTLKSETIEDASELTANVEITTPGESANDNVATPKLAAPSDETRSDVEQFYDENVEAQEGSSLTATALYEDYCAWCESNKKEPLALPTFGRELGDLGVNKAKIAGRVRYIGIALRSVTSATGDKNSPVPIVKVA